MSGRALTEFWRNGVGRFDGWHVGYTRYVEKSRSKVG